MATVSVLLNLISIYHQILTAVRSVMAMHTDGHACNLSSPVCG